MAMLLRAVQRASPKTKTLFPKFSGPGRRFGSVPSAWNLLRLQPNTCLKRRCSTEQRVVSSPFNDVEVPAVSVAQYLWQRVDEWPEKTAIVCGVSGRSLTYAQLREKCRRLSRALRRAGLEPGMVVGVVLPNSPDYPIAILGAIEAGLVVTTVNPDYTPDEIARQLLDSDARLIVTFPEKYEEVVAATLLVSPHGYRAPIIVVTESAGMTGVPEGAVDIRAMIDSMEDMPSISDHVIDSLSPVMMPYSSGTTGLPKGVLLSHRNIIASMAIHGEPNINVLQSTSANYQDCLPAVLPFFHVYGMVVILLYSLSMGCKVVTLPKFEPKTFLGVLNKHKASVLYLAPLVVTFLGQYAELKPEHLSSLNFVISGSAPLGEMDVDKFLKKAPKSVKLLQGYGLTETSPVICLSRTDTKKMSSVGPCVPNTMVKIIDPKTGESLGPHQKGEVCVKGPQVMLRYHNHPEETTRVIDQAGWFHTGDIGYYDNDEDFYIVDRLKDLIKVKGYSVAPAELEELLRSHPDVLDAAVVGAPDERRGEAVHAYIVLKPSSKASKELEKKVKSFVANKVVEYKQLSKVNFAKSIPKNASGKILRKILKGETKKEKGSK